MRGIRRKTRVNPRPVADCHSAASGSSAELTRPGETATGKAGGDDSPARIARHSGAANPGPQWRETGKSPPNPSISS
jgi:hypothetical protein